MDTFTTDSTSIWKPLASPLYTPVYGPPKGDLEELRKLFKIKMDCTPARSLATEPKPTVHGRLDALTDQLKLVVGALEAINRRLDELARP